MTHIYEPTHHFMSTIKAWPLTNQLAGYFKMSKKCLRRMLVIEALTTG